MGLFSKPRPPPVPQASTIVSGQQAASQAAGQATQTINSTGQSTPYNNLSYSFNPSTGQWEAQNQYSPEQQQQLDYLQAAQRAGGSQAATLLGNTDYGALPDISGDAQSQTEKLIAQQMQQLRPEQDYQTSNLDTKLRNQGLTPGTEAYDNQMREFQANLANNNASNAAQFENQAYGQALQNYQLPEDMATKLAQFGGPVGSTANLINTPTTQVQTPDVNAAYGTMTQAQQAQYKAQMEQYSGLMKGIFGTAAGVAAAPFTGGTSLAMIPGMFGGGSGSGTLTPQQFSQQAYAPGVTGQFATPIY